MEAVGDITHAEAQAALATGPGSVKRETLAGRYFADWVRDSVDQYDPGDRDVVVRTTIDMGLQRKAESLLQAMLAGPAAKANASQGAIVVMSPDGAVRAMVGGLLVRSRPGLWSGPEHLPPSPGPLAMSPFRPYAGGCFFYVVF